MQDHAFSAAKLFNGSVFIWMNCIINWGILLFYNKDISRLNKLVMASIHVFGKIDFRDCMK